MEWLFYAPLLVVGVLNIVEILQSGVGRTDWNWLWTPNAWQNYSWSKFQWPGTWRFFVGMGTGIACGFILRNFVGHDLAEAASYGCSGLGVVVGYIWDITTDTSGKAL